MLLAVALSAVLAQAPPANSAGSFTAGVPQDKDQYMAALKTVVHESNQCVLTEITRRLPENATSIADDQRSAIRLQAVDACFEYAGRLARFANTVKDEESFKAARLTLLTQMVAIADADITITLRQNAKGAARQGPATAPTP